MRSHCAHPMFIYRCTQETYWRRCPKRCFEATIRAIEIISIVSGNALLQAAGNLSTFVPAQNDYVRMDNIRYCDISHPACAYLPKIHTHITRIWTDVPVLYRPYTHTDMRIVIHMIQLTYRTCTGYLHMHTHLYRPVSACICMYHKLTGAVSSAQVLYPYVCIMDTFSSRACRYKQICTRVMRGVHICMFLYISCTIVRYTSNQIDIQSE
jgi:hypothetical protein